MSSWVWIVCCVLGNGYITVEDFKVLLRELDPEIPQEEINGMVNEIDQNDSGTIDLDGELAFVGHIKHVLQTFCIVYDS